MNNNVRYNISPCTDGEVQEFVGRIDKTLYRPNGETKASADSHYDRYSYLRDGCRVAIVFDIKASTLSITSRPDLSDELLALFGAGSDRIVKRSLVPAGGRVIKPIQPQPAPARHVSIDVDMQQSNVRAKLFAQPDEIRRRAGAAVTQTTIVTKNGQELSTDEIYPPQTIRIDRRPRTVGDKPAGPAKPMINTVSTVYRSAEDGSIKTERNMNMQKSGAGCVPTVAPKPKAPSVEAYFAEKDKTEKPTAVGKSAARSGADTDGRRPAVGIVVKASAKQTAVRQDKKSTPAQAPAAPRAKHAVISFGDDDDDFGGKGFTSIKASDVRTRTGTGLFADIASPARQTGAPPAKQSAAEDPDVQPEKRKRGRPKKQTASADIVAPPAQREQQTEPAAPEYKNGYSLKNFPESKFTAFIKRLKTDGYEVKSDGTEFAGTSQEVRKYIVTDKSAKLVYVRYFVKKTTVQLWGKRSALFGEVQASVSLDSDYSSALEGYVENSGGKKKVSEVESKLKKRLPNAYDYLSEQSRIDFSYGIHDFGRSELQLSDYSVLLVPPFRGLERFIFDLQRAEGIKVKMIGQAYDKDDSGKYILKNGYAQRIGSVIYCEVMVALYTEYFMQRNFFAHSDNSDDSRSRAIPDRTVAKNIFESLLDTVEYNARKLKEIGFSIDGGKREK